MRKVPVIACLALAGCTTVAERNPMVAASLPARAEDVGWCLQAIAPTPNEEFMDVVRALAGVYDPFARDGLYRLCMRMKGYIPVQPEATPVTDAPRGQEVTP